MIKKIPGSLDFRINLRGQVFDHNGNLVTLPTDGSDVRIILYGEERTVSLTWLSLLAWYECGSINNLHKHLDKIEFCAANMAYLRIRCGKIMTFKEPIYYKDGFRYIPNFPRYAISFDGRLLDTSTNVIINDVKMDDKGYNTHYIRTPDRNCNRTVKCHRLVALAWIPNTDFVTRPLVNHVDGIKTNNTASNLEWCSPSENITHALETGLNNCNIRVKVRDVRTGDIVVYNSLNEAIRKLGMGVGTSIEGIRCKLPGYLWNKRYEIKTLDDDTAWYYEKVDPNDFRFGKSFYTITVYDKQTGSERKFNCQKKLALVYGLRYKSISLDDFISRFKEALPHCDIKYDRNTLKGPYRVHDRETKTLYTFTSLEQVSKHIGRSKAEIQVDLSRGKKFIYGGKWIIFVDVNTLDYNEYIDKPLPWSRISIVDVNTGVETIAVSMKHASKITGVNPKTIRVNLETGKVTKGLLFRALDS